MTVPSGQTARVWVLTFVPAAAVPAVDAESIAVTATPDGQPEAAALATAERSRPQITRMRGTSPGDMKGAT